MVSGYCHRETEIDWTQDSDDWSSTGLAGAARAGTPVPAARTARGPPQGAHFQEMQMAEFYMGPCNKKFTIDGTTFIVENGVDVRSVKEMIVTVWNPSVERELWRHDCVALWFRQETGTGDYGGPVYAYFKCCDKSGRLREDTGKTGYSDGMAQAPVEIYWD